MQQFIDLFELLLKMRVFH